MDSAIAAIRRVLVLRLKRGEDLMDSLYEACGRYQINSAVIMSMIGSVQEAEFYDPRPDDTDPAGVSYGEPIRVAYPAELLSANGEITHLDDGSTSIHVHALFADRDGRVSGGHLMRGGNKALNTVNIFIGILEGIDMGVKYDPVLEAPVFCPKEL